jgi:hypothetical protein
MAFDMLIDGQAPPHLRQRPEKPESTEPLRVAA